MADNKLTLKLLIDNTTRKVLFAEAGKTVVDFLFSLLGMPVGIVTKLLRKDDDLAGSITNIYESLYNLEETYIVNEINKKQLLNPSAFLPSPSAATLLQLPLPCSSSTTGDKYYMCSNTHCKHYITNCHGTRCPSCGCTMASEMILIDQKPKEVPGATSAREGCVKGLVTYMIMDNLAVMPMSTISGIILLNKFKVKDLGALQEMTVEIGIEEGLKILKACFKSNTVLTDVFLGCKAVEEAFETV